MLVLRIHDIWDSVLFSKGWQILTCGCWEDYFGRTEQMLAIADAGAWVLTYEMIT